MVLSAVIKAPVLNCKLPVETLPTADSLKNAPRVYHAARKYTERRSKVINNAIS
jgi:hypothetical protein